MNQSTGQAGESGGRSGPVFLAQCEAADRSVPCPAAQLAQLLAGRWTMPVLNILLRTVGTVRFNALRRELGVAQKELTRVLRELERRGFVERTVFAEVPPRVEYALTPLGGTLREPLDALARWAARVRG